jgi:putative PEP-CTERM system histidine kinase
MLTSVATVSYATAAVAYLFLAILLLTSWRGHLHGMVLTIACLLSVLWAATLAYQATAQEQQISLFTDLLEILRNAGWTTFLVILLGLFRKKDSSSPQGIRPIVVFGMVLYLVFSLISLYSHSELDTSLSEPFNFKTSILVSVAMAIVGMILVEQLYRNTPAKQRWGIKFVCLGIGGAFAYDFYLYSDALLFGYVNPEIWTARGIVNAITVPLVAVSAARNPEWSLGIVASRRILFYFMALFCIAIYLLVMVAVGYYLRFSGGDWGTVLQVAFFFGALILLFGVLFSGTIRSWLKITISKHFFSYNYDYREEWLRFTGTLSEGELRLEERIIQALAQLVESPGGALWIKKESGNYEPVTHWNMPFTNESFNTVHSSSFQFLDSKDPLIEIQEYSKNPKRDSRIALPHWIISIPNAWLLIPLIQHQTFFGFVVLAKPRSKVILSWEVIDLLKVASNQASSYLAQHEATNALMVARQFESFNRMSAFMIHDLKNLVSQLSLLLSNTNKHKTNPEFQKDMVETVSLSIQKMKRLLEKLSDKNSIEKPVPLLIDQLLQEIVESRSSSEPRPILEVIDPNLTVFANLFRLERAIGNLVQNAIEASSRNDQIRVCLMRQENSAVIEIIDTGHGMSEEFIREKLFIPFESTKSVGMGMGIGVFESREYICELGGQLKVVSSLSGGTTFHVVLPLYKHVNNLQIVASR